MSASPPPGPTPPPAWLAARIAGLLLLGACGPDPGSEPASTRPLRSVLLVTFDTTRADRIGCYGGAPGVSPTLDRLAAEGVRFEWCSSPVPHTQPSHTSLLTGEPPPVHGVRVNGLYRLPDAAHTLAEAAREGGMATGAFVSAPVLNEVTGLDQGFDEYDDRFEAPDGVAHPLRPAAETSARCLEWLDSLEDGVPFFAWVHFFEPHLPWEVAPALRGRFASDYEAEIHQADLALSNLLRGVRERGREDFLLCVTADHGESLGEHGEDTHGVFVYEAALRVPLVFWSRDLEPAVVHTRVGLVDVAPTLLDWCGLESFECGGQSLHAVLTGEQVEPAERPVYLETYVPWLSYNWSPSEALIEQGWKYIASPQSELYDLHDDPTERHNRHDNEPERVERMKSRLEQFRLETDRHLPHDQLRVDDALLARLAAMGYTLEAGGDGTRLPSPDDGAGPDVKERIHLLTPLHNMIVAGVEGRGDEVLTTGAKVLAIEADNPTALQHVGIELCKRGHHEEALRHLVKLEAAGRSTAASLLSMGVALLHVDEADQAAATLRRSAELEPTNPRTLRWLGEAEEKRGDIDKALEAYRLLLEDFEGPEGARKFIEEKVRTLENGR